MTTLKKSLSVEQLPALKDEYTITQEKINSYQRDGHLRLNNVIDASEINAYRPFIVDAVNRKAEQQRLEVMAQIEAEENFSEHSSKWKILNNMRQFDPVVKRFVLARRFGKIAADVMGVDGVRVLLDQSFFKEPGGGNTAWHQDNYFTPLDSDNTVTIWIPLSNVSAEMAPMTFVSGSHKHGYLGTSTPVEADMEKFAESMVQKGFQLKNYGAIKAGDVSLHSGWTLHSSGTNVSQQTREAMLIVYYADGAKISLPDVLPDACEEERFAAQMRQRNLGECLPGLKHGDLAQTDFNPIIYQR